MFTGAMGMNGSGILKNIPTIRLRDRAWKIFKNTLRISIQI